MRGNENESHRDSEGSLSLFWWVGWHRVPATNKQRKYSLTHHLHSNDRSTGANTNYLSREELTYRIGITFLSAGTFGIGIGQCIAKVLGW